MLDRMVKVTGIKSVARRKFSEDLLQLPSRDGNVLVQGIESHFLRCVLRLGGPTLPVCTPNKSGSARAMEKGSSCDPRHRSGRCRVRTLLHPLRDTH